MFVFAEVRDIPEHTPTGADSTQLLEFEHAYFEALRVLRNAQGGRPRRQRRPRGRMPRTGNTMPAVIQAPFDRGEGLIATAQLCGREYVGVLFDVRAMESEQEDRLFGVDPLGASWGASAAAVSNTTTFAFTVEQVLRTRLYDAQREATQGAEAEARKAMVGSGDRSERIRTYNYPQGRVTDHRIGLTLQKLPQIIAGPGLGELVDALIAEDEAKRLAAMAE